MDNKQQRTADDHERPHPSGNMGELDKDSARPYKAHQKAITKGLRTFFDSVAAEPVPHEFMALLQKMDGSET